MEMSFQACSWQPDHRSRWRLRLLTSTTLRQRDPLTPPRKTHLRRGMKPRLELAPGTLEPLLFPSTSPQTQQQRSREKRNICLQTSAAPN